MAALSNGTELQIDSLELVQESTGRNERQDNGVQSLPPADGGKDAWLFLMSVFLFEAVIWGL